MRTSHTSTAALALLGLPLVAVLGVALALVLTPAGAATGKREGCGRFESASVYEKAKVIAIRGVDCGEARRVAKKYDHKGVAKGNWKCALGHGGRRLFSCGHGGSSGNLADFKHALVAKGVGSPNGR